jgi:hypothetical protein
MPGSAQTPWWKHQQQNSLAPATCQTQHARPAQRTHVKLELDKLMHDREDARQKVVFVGLRVLCDEQL